MRRLFSASWSRLPTGTMSSLWVHFGKQGTMGIVCRLASLCGSVWTNLDIHFTDGNGCWQKYSGVVAASSCISAFSVYYLMGVTPSTRWIRRVSSLLWRLVLDRGCSLSALTKVVNSQFWCIVRKMFLVRSPVVQVECVSFIKRNILKGDTNRTITLSVAFALPPLCLSLTNTSGAIS